MAEMIETKVLAPEDVEGKSRVVPEEAPILPTRGAVIYPYLVVPLFVGRPRSVEALEAAMKEERRIVLVAQRNIDVDDPGPEDVYAIGTLAEVVQLLRLPDGTIRVMIEGFERVRIKSFVQTDPYLRASISSLPEVEEPGIETEALVRNVVAQFERLINLGKNLPAEALETARRMSDPGRLADLIAYYTQIPVEVKQHILEAANQRERLETLANVLNREIEILEVERKISSRVKKELEELPEGVLSAGEDEGHSAGAGRAGRALRRDRGSPQPHHRGQDAPGGRGTGAQGDRAPGADARGLP